MSSAAPDYADRPAKEVSRRIFIEVLRRMRPMGDLSEYAYVGLGSHQFVDFDLVHRALGITRMTSIESETKLEARCQFNKPFAFIRLEMGTTTTVLPRLDWARRHIVWLDYTQRLRREELADCENLALRLAPGSVLAVTLNCQPGRDRRLDALREAVGPANVPFDATEDRLGDWGLASTQRDLLSTRFHRTFSVRGDGAAWQQLLNIHYRDDARMQLLVGVVDHPDLHDAIQACRLGEMAEVTSGATPVEIVLPRLTTRERQELDKRAPGKPPKAFAGLSADQVGAYAKFYRWLDPVI